MKVSAYEEEPCKGRKRPQSTKNGRKNSTETIHEDTTISDSFNSHRLLRSFDPGFNIHKVMQRLFPAPRRSPSRPTPAFVSPKSRPKRLSSTRQTDSIFSTGASYTAEADLLLSEFTHNPRLLKHPKRLLLLRLLKQHPQLLLSLIPLPVTSPRAASTSRRSAMRVSNFNTGKTDFAQSSTTTSLGEEVESLRTQPDESLTEDWAKSILYQKIKAGKMRFNDENEDKFLTEAEIMSCAYHYDDLELLYSKSLYTLEQLLVEMLGTREDALRFQEKYASCSRRSVKQLVTKCQEMLNLRTAICEMLVKVREREKVYRRVMRRVEDAEEVKREVVFLFTQGRMMNSLIENWLKLDPPFSSFIYRDANYLDRIADQNMESFLHLARVKTM